MKTRLGKIAQLPKSIRNQLNRRLDNGQQSPEILRWLNRLPQTKCLLAKKFDRQPINKANLSHWRHGGFLEWQNDQARQAHIQRISESGESLRQAETGDLFENFARLAVAELMADLDGLQKFRGQKRSLSLHNLIRDLARLQLGYNHSRRTALSWRKWNHRFLGPDDYKTQDSKPKTRNPNPGSAGVPPADGTTTTPSPSTAVKPGDTGLQNNDSCNSQPYDPFKRVYHTRCCNQPCPKCHAPESEYPIDEIDRDRDFYVKNNGRDPYDRYGHIRHQMHTYCGCSCDRCNQESAASQSPPPATIPSKTQNETPAPIPAFPTSATVISLESPLPLDPRPSTLSNTPYDPIADFNRQMSHLKSRS